MGLERIGVVCDPAGQKSGEFLRQPRERYPRNRFSPVINTLNEIMLGGVIGKQQNSTVLVDNTIYDGADSEVFTKAVNFHAVLVKNPDYILVKNIGLFLRLVDKDL